MTISWQWLDSCSPRKSFRFFGFLHLPSDSVHITLIKLQKLPFQKILDFFKLQIIIADRFKFARFFLYTRRIIFSRARDVTGLKDPRPTSNVLQEKSFPESATCSIYTPADAS